MRSGISGVLVTRPWMREERQQRQTSAALAARHLRFIIEKVVYSDRERASRPSAGRARQKGVKIRAKKKTRGGRAD